MIRNLAEGADKNLLVAIGMLALIAVGIGTQHLRLSAHNLAGHDAWISTKATLGKRVVGAQNFLTGRQTLAFGHLDLSAWHGFQEIITRERFDPQEVSFDFRLAEDAYLVFRWDAPAGGYHGFIFSAFPELPPMFFSASPEGEFLATRPVELSALQPGRWHEARFEFQSGGVAGYLDDAPFGSIASDGSADTRVGFRGGFDRTLVDNVVVDSAQGSFEENFSNTAAILPSALIAGLVIVAANLIFCAIVLRRGGSRNAWLSALAFNLLLVGAAGALYAFRYYGGSLYPGKISLFEQEEQRWMSTEAARINDLLLAEYAAPDVDDARRILFIGSSQTWGAGARDPNETFVRRIENALNQRANEVVICINGGISALRSSHLLDLYKTQWLDLQPDVVVINLSNNDTDPALLERNIDSMIQLSQARSIRVLLVLEPNSIEKGGRGLAEKHAVLRRLARQRGVQLVDMHAYLSDRYRRGFLWWDTVHLSSFGQRLFAERLVDALAQLSADDARAF